MQSALGKVAPSIGQGPRGLFSSAEAGTRANERPAAAAPTITAAAAPPPSTPSPPPSIEDQRRIALSRETPWHHTLALAVACLLALLVHGLIVGLLFSQIWLFAEEAEEKAPSLEEQVIAVVELPPPEAQPEEAQPEEPQSEEAQPEPPQGEPVAPNDSEFPANQIDIGRVNQGADTGGGETAQTGALDAAEPEPAADEAAKPDAAPPPAEIEEPPTPLPEPVEPDTPPPEPVPLPTPIVPPPELAETPPEVEPLPEPAPEPVPEAVPEAEISAELTFPTDVPPTDLPEITRPSDRPEPDPAVEALNLDNNLTEVLVTAALDRDGELENPTPNGPMAVPPAKPQREVTLPPVPRPARSERQRETKGEPSEQRSGRQASNVGAGDGQGGGYGGGSETNYLGLVARELNRQKVFPADAKARGEEGTVVVRFAVDDEGWVIARRILRSSGYRSLDAETMDLLIRASPLPPPPGKVDRLTMTITLRFYQ